MQHRHEAVLTTRGDTTKISSVDSRKAKSSSTYIVYRVIISVGHEKCLLFREGSLQLFIPQF